MSAIGNEALINASSRRQLWFGLLGGALAWLIHFFTAYAAAEFGCVSGWGKQQWAGVSVVAWFVLGVTMVMVVVGLAAAGTAYRLHQQLQTGSTDPTDQVRSERYLALAGTLTSSIFVAVVLFETIPVFFYLQRC